MVRPIVKPSRAANLTLDEALTQTRLNRKQLIGLAELELIGSLKENGEWTFNRQSIHRFCGYLYYERAAVSLAPPLRRLGEAAKKVVRV